MNWSCGSLASNIRRGCALGTRSRFFASRRRPHSRPSSSRARQKAAYGATNEWPGELEMRFMALFDWNHFDYCDFQYYRVQIAGSAKHPHLLGREALIERQCVNVFLTEPPQADAAA